MNERTSVAYRLSDQTLGELDRICALTEWSKTQAVSTAIKLLLVALTDLTQNPERLKQLYVDLPEQRRP